MFKKAEENTFWNYFVNAVVILLMEGAMLFLVWNFVVTALWVQAPFVSIVQAYGLIILRQLVLKK